MTSSGRRIAFFIGLVIAFALPKRIECGYPTNDCAPGARCKPYELEPLGFYAIEWVIGRNVGFAYTRDVDCG